VLVDDRPLLYVERGGRGLVTLGEGVPSATGAHGLKERPIDRALGALAEAVRGGRVERLKLERIDGEPAIASGLAQALIELGFQSGPRRLTLSA
jgi:ATP-dependent Lhr-like helicase